MASEVRGARREVSKDVIVTEDNLDLFTRATRESLTLGDVVSLVLDVDRQDNIAKSYIQVEGSTNTSYSLTLEEFAELYYSSNDFRTLSIDRKLVSNPQVLNPNLEESMEKRAAEASESIVARAPSPSGSAASRTSGTPRVRRSARTTANKDVDLLSPQKEAAMKLADFLGTVGLEALATPLWEAQVRSVAALARHSIAELEESLRRPKASGGMGAKFTLSSVQRRGLRELGLPDELAAEVFPDAPEGDSDTEGLTEEAATQKLAALAGPLLTLPTAPKSKVGNALTKGGKRSPQHGAELAAALAGGGAPVAAVLLTGLDEPGIREAVIDMANDMIAALEGASAPRVEATATTETAVDRLDVLLERALESRLGGKASNSSWAASMLMPPQCTVRSARKQLAKFVLKAADEQLTVEKKEPSKAQPVGEFDKLASVLAATQEPTLSASDQKVSEEIAASSARVTAVADVESSRRLLVSLAEAMESSVDNQAKLAAFALAANEDAKLADLLHASHVREDRFKGDAHFAHPCARETAKCVRRVRNGFKAALKAVLRRLVPTSADVTSLVEQAFFGTLVGEGSLKLEDLMDSSKSKPWLGSQAKGSELITLLAALPSLTFSLSACHPSDETVNLTMAVLTAELAKGLRVHAAKDVVAGLLVPFFRAYSEAVLLSQRSATVAMPKLGEVWRRECSDPSSQIGAYLTRSAAADVTGTGQSAAEPAEVKRQVEAALRPLTQRLARAEAKLPSNERRGGERPGGGGAGGGGGSGAPGDGPPLTEEERAARKAKNKLKNERRKSDMKAGRAARQGSASGAESDGE
jgi:hypothetical protein